MDASEIAVLVGGVAAILGIGWYFLGPRDPNGSRAHNLAVKGDNEP